MVQVLKLSDIYVKKTDIVTTSKNGLMSYQDKLKIDNLNNTIANAIGDLDLVEIVVM